MNHLHGQTILSGYTCSLEIPMDGSAPGTERGNHLRLSKLPETVCHFRYRLRNAIELGLASRRCLS